MARLERSSELIRVAAQRTLEETHQILVATAKREHARVMNTAPKPMSFERYVDGAFGAPEESVRPDGVITYLYPRIDEVVEIAMALLSEYSPVLTGAYRSSHTLYVGGVAAADLDGATTGDEIFIANPLPYSRKIELGRMTMRVSGTTEVYARAASALRGRFGNVASIKMSFRPTPAGPIVPYRGRGLQRPSQEERESRVPAIVIRPL